jgi:hypothetical protein
MWFEVTRHHITHRQNFNYTFSGMAHPKTPGIGLLYLSSRQARETLLKGYVEDCPPQ